MSDPNPVLKKRVGPFKGGMALNLSVGTRHCDVRMRCAVVVDVRGGCTVRTLESLFFCSYGRS